MRNFKSCVETCARSCSGSYINSLDRDTFTKILKNEIDIPEKFEINLIHFMNETPIDMVCRCFYELNLGFDYILILNQKLPEGFQAKRIKEVYDYFRNNKKTFK